MGINVSNLRSLLVEVAPAVMLSAIASRTLLQSNDVSWFDNIIKGIFFLACVVGVTTRIKITVNKKTAIIIMSLIMYSILPVVHHLMSEINDAKLIENEQKEILRLIFACLVILFTGLFSSQKVNVINIAIILSLVGAVTGVFAIYDAMTGSAQNVGRYVSNGLMRAGSETSDSNALSAFLNICSFMCIYLFMVFKSVTKKILSAFLFSCCLIGRLATFSTGGHIGFIVTAFIMLYVLKIRNQPLKVKISNVFQLLAVISVIFILIARSPELMDLLFSRLDYENQYMYEASIGSRLEQIGRFFEIVQSDMSGCIFGFGYAEVQYRMGLGFDMHNFILRAFSGGGVIGIIFYMVFITNIESSLRKSWVLSVDSNQGRERLFSLVVYAAFLGWIMQALTLPVDISVLTLVFAIFSAIVSKSVKQPNFKLGIKNAV
jgi:hypothetical protein